MMSLPVGSRIAMSSVRIFPQQQRQQKLDFSLAEYKTSPAEP